MVFCAACGIAAVSCYGEQSNSSDIATDQNNNQQNTSFKPFSEEPPQAVLFINTISKKGI